MITVPSEDGSFRGEITTSQLKKGSRVLPSEWAYSAYPALIKICFDPHESYTAKVNGVAVPDDNIVPQRVVGVVVERASGNPTSGPCDAGDQIRVDVEFDGNVCMDPPSHSGNTDWNLALETGRSPQAFATYSYDDDGIHYPSTLTLTYTVVDGDNTLENGQPVSLDYTDTSALSVGANQVITDTCGHAVNLALPTLGGGNSLAASRIAIDTRPKVVTVTPARNALIQSFTMVEVTFSEPVNLVSGHGAGDLTVNGSAATTLTLNNEAVTTSMPSSAGPYVFSGFSAPNDGLIPIALASGCFTDAVSNLFAGDTWTYKQFPECHTPAQDVDDDNDVDLIDFSVFRNCFNGPNRPWPTGGSANQPACACFDQDNDLAVDLMDFAEFRKCFNGPNRPPAPDCSVYSRPVGTLTDVDDPEVAFEVQSPQAGGSVTAGTPIEWHVNVCLTGDNQGLGAFSYSLFLGPDSGPGPGSDGVWGTPDDENLADVVLDVAGWSEAYAVTGANGKPTVGADVTAAGNQGGPGMSVLTSDGYNDRAGALLQVGSAHLDWDPWRYVSTGKNPGWYGDHTWGVGLDDRKDALLLDTAGAYELNVGSIDTTNLAAGHYVLTLVPASRIDLLRSDADLSVSQPGGILTPAGSVNGPVSIEFDIEE